MPAHEADRNAADTAITDDDIRANAEHGDGDFGIKRFQEACEIVLVNGKKQRVGRPTHAKPCVRRQRGVRDELATGLWEGGDVIGHHPQ